MTTTHARFECSLGNRILDLVLQLAAAAAAAFAIARFGVGNLSTVHTGALPIATFVAVLLAGVELCAYSFVSSRVVITVSPTTVGVVRGRKLQHSLARDAYSFSAPAPVNAGRRRPAERTLIAANGEEQLEIVCRQLSGSTFEKLVAVLTTERSPLS